MLAYDPDYVSTMMDSDFDPHIAICVVAGLMSEGDAEFYKECKKNKPTGDDLIRFKTLDSIRKMGKSTNYASVYGAGAPTIARSAGVSNSLGKTLFTGYWDLNWAVKAIAADQSTFEDSTGQKWLINPVNGFCYSLRAEKDIFSTLCQGTGSFFFDRWVDTVMSLMLDRFGVKRLSAAFHDEYVTVFKDTPTNREEMEAITHKAIGLVNEEYLLRRELGCDVQFGKDYSEIH